MTRPPQRISRRMRWLLLVACCVTLMGASLAFDRYCFVHYGDINVSNRDWYRMFRVAGYTPLWVLIAVAMLLIDLGHFGWAKLRQAMMRATLLLLATISSGIAADLVKLIVRRERPDIEHAGYVFRSLFDQTFHSGGLGFPSSHTTIAFAAAWMLTRLHPQAAPIWLLFAVGCGVSRLLRGAHYLSDVTAGAMLGCAVAFGVWQWHLYNERRRVQRLESLHDLSDHGRAHAPARPG